MASNSQKVAYSTIVQIASRVIVSGLGILSVGISTRYLGLDGYGQLTTAVIFLSLFQTLTDSGLNTITIRELARETHPRNFVIGNVVWLRAGIGLAAALLNIVLGFLIYNAPEDVHIRNALLLLSSTLILASIQTAITSGLAAKLRNDLIAIGDIVGRIAAVLWLFYAVKHNLGFNGIILGTVVGAIVNFIIGMAFGLFDVRPSLRIDRKYIQTILLLALPLAAATIINTIYYRVDGFLLSLIKGSNDVGLYGVAYKVVELTMAFPLLFMGAVFPIMARSYQDHARLRDITKRCVETLNLLGVPVLIGVAVLSPEIAKLLGGPEFVGAWVAMIGLMIGNYFIYLNSPLSSALVASNHQSVVLRLTGYNLVTNLILNLLLIPPFGPGGAGAAVAITEGLQQFYVRRYFGRYIGSVPRYVGYRRTVLAGLAMGVGVYALKIELQTHGLRNSLVLLACTCIGMIVYAILAYAMRLIRASEIRELIPSPNDQR